jgi:uncharacterized protein YgiM (DUF1202 family)
MNKIMLLAMLFSSLILRAQENTRYVAIKTGLNMRDKPDVGAKVIEKIPYATKIALLDNNEAMLTIKTEGLLGYWRKVSYNNKTGYVVDSYLFPLAPPKAAVKTMKDYLAQLSAPFGSKLVVKGGNEEIGWQLHKQLFRNGGEWHDFQGYEYGSDTYFLPDFTIQQTFLLLRMIPEFAEVIGAKDEFPRESKTLKKGDIDYVIKVESELYTEEPWIKRIAIEFEQGAVYSFEMHEVDNHVVIFYGSGV